jgi:hypothetical protein
MRKLRMTKSGQLLQLAEDEMDQAYSKDDRWTVRRLSQALLLGRPPRLNCPKGVLE